MGLYKKTGNGLINLAGANASGLPLGSIIENYNESIPEGFLKCDGSTFDENLYPALYLMLGTNKLPTLSSVNFNEDPDIAVTNTSTYKPTNVTYYSTTQACIQITGLQSKGFEYDGWMSIQFDDWYYLWIEDTDGTVRGYWVGYRDNGDMQFTLPVKKGQKIYGLNRNGGSTATPSTDIVNAEGFKLYVWYNKYYKLIKATPGFTEDQNTYVFNQIKDYINTHQVSPEMDLIKTYVKNQNKLSDWEDIVLANNATDAYEMPYDGFVSVGYHGSNSLIDGTIYINSQWWGELHTSGYNGYTAENLVIPFTKGDKIYITGNIRSYKVRYYKERDYE